jgi:hypothetical protein
MLQEGITIYTIFNPHYFSSDSTFNAQKRAQMRKHVGVRRQTKVHTHSDNVFISCPKWHKHSSLTDKITDKLLP